MDARTRIGPALLLAIAILPSGCQAPHLLELAGGQLAILRARQPVAQLQADPATPAALRDRLALAGELLDFAHAGLGLPDNGSYRQYVELGRDYPVWNVFAAPEFSLDLRSWCFPVAGCTVYRGYFDEAGARAHAQELAGQGLDVFVGPAVAYSTLGFFRDPLLSSVMALPEVALAGLLFHELAHQQLYVAGDTAFSESFATVVEREGVLRWLQARGDREELCRFLDGLERREEVWALITAARLQLAAVYGSTAADADRRAAKAAVFAQLRHDYAALRATWPGPPWFDGWLAGPLNNARLGALAAYDQHVAALQLVLAAEGGDLPAFYRRAERLGRLRIAERADILAYLGAGPAPAPDAPCRAASADLQQQVP